MHLLERLRFRTLSTPRPFCAVQPNGRPYRRSLSQAEQVVRGPAPASITNAPVHANCRRLAAVDAAELTIKVPGDRGGVACRTMECDGGGRGGGRSVAGVQSAFEDQLFLPYHYLLITKGFDWPPL